MSSQAPVFDKDGEEPSHWVVGLTDDAIYQCPFVMASDVGTMGLSVVEAAHNVGFRTTSTVMYGHIDGPVNSVPRSPRAARGCARSGFHGPVKPTGSNPRAAR